MGGPNLLGTVVAFFAIVIVVVVVVAIIFTQSRKAFREQKSYERGLKMVPLLIHLPPPSDDIDVGSRDQRDVMDEVISQAQTMYNVISSTATKGFKSRFYGQRHISFELVAHDGLIRYYVVVPTVLLETIKQAVVAAYPAARLEEVEEINLFSSVGKISGTVGGEFSLKKEYSFPIATYQESKRDAMRAILNALSSATREDGVGIQVMLRPANDDWLKTIEKRIKGIREGRRGASSGKSSSFSGGGDGLGYFVQLLEALWKPPSASDKPKDTNGATADKEVSGIDKAKIEAMEDKTRYAGYEVLIRVVASSSTSARSQILLGNVVSAFALFDSPTKNGFTFTPAHDIEQFVTAYIFRFFPPEMKSNILNTVELATIFHLPDQNSVPSSQVERQKFKQVDGPSEMMDEGLLLGYNVFRGTKKPIRLSANDRRRHIYIMGSTGMGKSVLLENLALQDMLDGRGFAFVDPHGDSAENLLAMVPKERVEDVIYFDPSDMENPIGMNLFEVDPQDPDPERTKDYIISETMNMLYSLYDPGHTGIVGPRMENIVRNAALLLMADPAGGTFMDIPYVLTDPDVVKHKLPYLTNERAINFWTKEWPNAQRSNDAGEVTSWVVSKWASFENAMMSNILGQIHSALNLRDIMDQKKILLVNLSKGKLGEMPSKLLGMVFVMKFQAAAMSRANIPESERKDFCLYVDEFQNFATDSFESILSEARKYRLNLIVANQFMSQLTDKIRSAITGNAGSFLIGRVGFEDAEQVVKIFNPVFDAEDLQFMPNYTAVCKILINGMPTSPFSMELIPPMGHPNQQLADALHRLSAAKYGRPRAEVEAEIHHRLNAASEAKEKDKQARLEAMRNSSIPVPGGQPQSRPAGQMGAGSMSSAPVGGLMPMSPSKPAGGSSSFLDDWLAKRQQISPQAQTLSQPQTAPVVAAVPSPVAPAAQPQSLSLMPAAPSMSASVPPSFVTPASTMSASAPSAAQSSKAIVADQLQEAEAAAENILDEAKEAATQAAQSQPTELRTADDGVDEVFIDLRGNIHSN